MTGRPNILYIFTDQQSASVMSCAGNTNLNTPAVDSLARDGARFETAYCTQPLCTPSRGSMFTGLMPHQCGAWRNGEPIRAELRGRELGRLLADDGYDCVYGGKWHVPEGAMPEGNDHGFRVLCGFDDSRLADACVDYFAEFAERDGANRSPFFAVASFDNPHNICEWGRNMALPWVDPGDPPPVEECPNLPANFMPAPFEPEILRVEQACNWAIYPYRTRSPEDWRRLRWAYFRLVEAVDREIGRILDGLQAHGLTENTVVIFSSDHGEAHGAHQLNQKSFLYEEQTRVPMIIRAPGGRPGIVNREHLVSNGLDLFPTVCDYAGIDPPDDLPGRSLRPLVEGRRVERWRNALFVETYLDGGRGYDVHGRAVRTPQHKYIAYDRGNYREQLFNLADDPGERVNLAVEARHRELLAEHRRLLVDHGEATDDRRFRVPGHCNGWRRTVATR